jgi:H+-transporting ATPase
VLTLATVLGVLGGIASFGLFWVADQGLRLPRAQTQTLIFLKLLVAGHLTIYITRNAGTFWQRPWPALRLVVATEATQILGTLAAVYGVLVEPIGWELALGVWAYALVWFLVNDAVKIAVVRMLAGAGARGRRVHRAETFLHGAALRGAHPMSPRTG